MRKIALMLAAIVTTSALALSGASLAEAKSVKAKVAHPKEAATKQVVQDDPNGRFPQLIHDFFAQLSQPPAAAKPAKPGKAKSKG